MRYDVVIWDWNGTLADDLDASLRATNDILAKRGRPPITLAQYYSYIDSPISRFYEHLFDLQEVPMEIIGQEFTAFYPKYFTGLHRGARELLHALRDSGVRQVILSSSHRDIILRDTQKLGVLPCFDEILAADDLLARGKTEQGKAWVDAQNVPPERMVLVGDTLHDYAAACGMGTDCILCAIGHQSEDDLNRAGVTVVKDFSELQSILLG